METGNSKINFLCVWDWDRQITNISCCLEKKIPKYFPCVFEQETHAFQSEKFLKREYLLMTGTPKQLCMVYAFDLI